MDQNNAIQKDKPSTHHRLAMGFLLLSLMLQIGAVHGSPWLPQPSTPMIRCNHQPALNRQNQPSVVRHRRTWTPETGATMKRYPVLPLAFFAPNFSMIPMSLLPSFGNGGLSLTSKGIFLTAVGTISGFGILTGITSERIRRAVYFWMHAGPVVAHYKFAQWWLEISNASLEKRDLVYDKLHNKYSQPTMDLILQLKGLFVKVGQVVGGRPDFVPQQYISLFSTLHDSIPQWPIEQVQSILRESLLSDLGLEYEDVFDSIDPMALGSASIAQVHSK